MGDISWIPGGLIGWRKISTQKPANDRSDQVEVKDEYQEGAVLAVRKGGDEALFACSIEDTKIPAEWILMGQFVVNPIAIATEEDFLEDEEEETVDAGDGGRTEIVKTGSDPANEGPRAHRGPRGVIRRREETTK